MLSLAVLIGIGVIGFVVLGVSLVLDDFFDFFGGEPVIPTAAVFTSFFGFSSALAVKITDGSELSLLLIPSGIALVVAALFYVAWAGLKAAADKDEAWQADPQSLVGAEAKVHFWHGRTGEVVVTYEGRPLKIAASSPEDLTTNQKVQITRVFSIKKVEVTALEVF